MKLSLLAAVLVFAFASASHADLADCKQNVKDSHIALTGVENLRIQNSTACKIVISEGVRNVVFITSSDSTGVKNAQIFSVDTVQKTASTVDLEYNYVLIGDASNKVFQGRLFLVLSSGQIYEVGRNNNIYELGDSYGYAYEDAVGLGVQKDSNNKPVALLVNRGSSVVEIVFAEEIDARIALKYTALVGATN